MTLPPAVIVHSLAQARNALAIGRPLTLLSAPGAALYAGALWWQQLVNEACFAGPALLDCTQAPGRAAESLALRHALLVLAPCPAWPELAAWAGRQGGEIFMKAPPALDMATPNATWHLEGWLAG